MYPFIRMAYQMVVTRKLPDLPVTGTHVSYHRCWPWDIDMWMELNNGRTLTLLDLGRIPLARRIGLIPALRNNRWGLTMAGVSVRWRQRVRAFEKVEVHSRVVGWDDRFIYIEQSMWKRDGTCANHALYRSAVTSSKGIVPTVELAKSMGLDPQGPDLPGWVKAWIAADAERRWPPERAAA